MLLYHSWNDEMPLKQTQNSLKIADFCLEFHHLLIHSYVYRICFVKFSKQLIQHLSNEIQILVNDTKILYFHQCLNR